MSVQVMKPSSTASPTTPRTTVSSSPGNCGPKSSKLRLSPEGQNLFPSVIPNNRITFRSPVPNHSAPIASPGILSADAEASNGSLVGSHDSAERGHPHGHSGPLRLFHYIAEHSDAGTPPR